MLYLDAYKATSQLNKSKDKQADGKRKSMHQPASRSGRQGKGSCDDSAINAWKSELKSVGLL